MITKGRTLERRGPETQPTHGGDFEASQTRQQLHAIGRKWPMKRDSPLYRIDFSHKGGIIRASASAAYHLGWKASERYRDRTGGSCVTDTHFPEAQKRTAVAHGLFRAVDSNRESRHGLV